MHIAGRRKIRRGRGRKEVPGVIGELAMRWWDEGAGPVIQAWLVQGLESPSPEFGPSPIGREGPP